MSFNRLLKYINIAIAVLLVALVGLVYWTAWRPLPQTSGTIRAAIAHRAVASRDAQGVPHIMAASIEDALFVQGYVTAQDRLWQMDGLRRLAGGDLAEIIGVAGLEADIEARRLRLRRIAEQAWATMPAPDRAALTAYARGVNEFIRTNRGRLPLEFTLLGYQPRPWSAVDSILAGLHMFRTLTTTWRDEIVKRSMLQGGDAAKVNFLFAARGGTEAAPGSNAWAVSGKRTASGRPLLANDMHLEFGIPGIWYVAHLQGPGLNVAGVTMPGAPGIVAGHNDRIAWGLTNLGFDVQDLYLERFDERTGRYLYKGQVEQARLEREIVYVKDAPPRDVLVWVTRHGPLFVSEGDDRMSLRWAAADAAASQIPLLDVNRARNWDEFSAALARFPGPALNWVYADVEGNIGYRVAGRLPLRRGYQGDVPADGISGDNEWDGAIPHEQLPFAFNPPSGMVVSANQNPFPPDYIHNVNGAFAPPYRANRIRELLANGSGLKPADMLRIQTDAYSAFSHFLAGQIVAAYGRRKANNPDLADAIALLRQWNGQMDKDRPEPLIATLAYQHLRRAVGENASPGKGGAWEYQMAPAVLERLLRSRPPGWFDEYDLLLLRTLVDAVEEGKRIQGNDVKRWIYGEYIALRMIHPVGDRLPLVGKYFNIGPVRMSGSSTTVKQTTRRLGPSMRMAADVGNWDASLLNIVTGQSGQILSSHYKDQWDAYYSGASFPMRFRNLEAKKTLEFLPAGR